MLSHPVLCCVSQSACCDSDCVCHGGLKIVSISGVGGDLSHFVYSKGMCLFDKIVLSVIDHFRVGSRALLREEEGLFVCACVHGHTFIQPPGEAESVECRGMPFLDGSSALLQTGEFCTLHSQHNTWFTLSHQRQTLANARSLCCTHMLASPPPPLHPGYSSLESD